jgi:hypothetical protein
VLAVLWAPRRLLRLTALILFLVRLRQRVAVLAVLPHLHPATWVRTVVLVAAVAHLIRAVQGSAAKVITAAQVLMVLEQTLVAVVAERQPLAVMVVLVAVVLVALVPPRRLLAHRSHAAVAVAVAAMIVRRAVTLVLVVLAVVAMVLALQLAALVLQTRVAVVAAAA